MGEDPTISKATEVILELYRIPNLYQLVFYSWVGVIGLVVNTMTCFIIMRNKETHTTINSYLFSLTISDIIILVLHFPLNFQYLLTLSTNLNCQFG